MEIRATRTAQRALTLNYHLVSESVLKARASRIVLEVIQHQDLVCTVLGALRDTFFQVQFIQRKFRVLREVMKSRTQSLRTLLLSRQTFLIRSSLLSGNKKNKELSFEIDKLSDSKKDFIAECVIQLAKFDYRAAFLVWFRDNKIEEDDPKRD
jgi:hypothetical protein